MNETTKQTAQMLAHLDSVYANYFARGPRMNAITFKKVKDKIDEIIRKFLPSPCKENINDMSSEIDEIFVQNPGISREEYWGEVWIRSGRKPLGEYNIKADGG